MTIVRYRISSEFGGSDFYCTKLHERRFKRFLENTTWREFKWVRTEITEEDVPLPWPNKEEFLHVDWGYRNWHDRRKR